MPIVDEMDLKATCLRVFFLVPAILPGKKYAVEH
jgi:hypothetical protein